jgi:two-component system, sensor histidine kinase and response regulator
LLDLTDEIYLPTRILVVDDDPPNLLAMEAVLEPLGHEIDCVRSGQEALALWNKNDFALALIDVRMRGLDGFETVKALTAVARNRSTPLVLVTAYDSSREDIQRGYACGAIDYVSKPVDPMLLRSKAKSLVLLHQRGAELKRRQEALLAAQAQVLRAEERSRRSEEEKRLQDMFIAILGHDLRNPLSVVSVTATKLRSCERCATSARRLENATARMNAIISAVTDFAHQHFEGGIPINPAPANLGDMCASVVHDFVALNPGRAIRLEMHDGRDPMGRPAIYGTFDRARLEQALSNLLTNAIKHGADPITVSAFERQGVLHLVVDDNGRGVPPDELPHLFDAFKKRRGSDGLGLGLFIVREIIRAHGGEVEVRSEPGQGTTFSCVWPVVVPMTVVA